MKEGDIVVAAFQQDDGKIKERPALVVSDLSPFHDFILCGISSQRWVIDHDANLNGQITEDHPNFADSGLKGASVFRLGFLYTIAKKHVKGKMGEINDSLYRDFIDRIINHLQNR